MEAGSPDLMEMQIPKPARVWKNAIGAMCFDGRCKPASADTVTASQKLFS